MYMQYKKILPPWLLSLYHFCIAHLAALRYLYPSRSMIVIGVTGTKGKTTTANFIWSCLSAGGCNTGLISTANIRIGKDEESLNHFHMTMPGRFHIQRIMKEMKEAGCTHCIIETTSEGIKQWRHAGIFYDIGLFTNLTPEHLPSHGGSFETYRMMKGKLFASLSKHQKYIDGKRIEKVILANFDSPEKNYFLAFPSDKKITYGTREGADIRAMDIQDIEDGVSFRLFPLSEPYVFHILGSFNVPNALAAVGVSKALGIADDAIRKGLKDISLIPGRMERIQEGQPFRIIVDYAHEKQSMTALLTSAKKMVQEEEKIIVLLGAEGGGRDKTKRPAMGEIAGNLADYVIVSNVDPYEDDPMEIIEDIARASESSGKKRNENLFPIVDRREGIRKALELAKPNDLVLITGKGSEQSIMVDGKTSPWDDRMVVREELKKI